MTVCASATESAKSEWIAVIVYQSPSTLVNLHVLPLELKLSIITFEFQSLLAPWTANTLSKAHSGRKEYNPFSGWTTDSALAIFKCTIRQKKNRPKYKKFLNALIKLPPFNKNISYALPKKIMYNRFRLNQISRISNQHVEVTIDMALKYQKHLAGDWAKMPAFRLSRSRVPTIRE